MCVQAPCGRKNKNIYRYISAGNRGTPLTYRPKNLSAKSIQGTILLLLFCSRDAEQKKQKYIYAWLLLYYYVFSIVITSTISFCVLLVKIYWLLPITNCLLPIAYHLWPTNYYLLPIAYSLLLLPHPCLN